MNFALRSFCLLSLLLCVAVRSAQVFELNSAAFAFSIHPARPSMDEGLQERDGRLARMFRWENSEALWTEMTFASGGRRLATCPEFRKLRVTLDVYVPEDSNASSVGLRFMDGDEEVYQYRLTIDPALRGWQSLQCEVDVAKPSGSRWGGKDGGNKIIDHPLRSYGMSIAFADKSRGGQLGFGALRIDVLDADITFQLDTGDPLFWTQADQPLQLRAVNETLLPQKETRHILLTGPFGEELLRQELSLELPAGTSVKALELPTPETYGVYHLRWGATPPPTGARPQASYIHMAQAAGPSFTPTKSFVFGICDHLERYPPAAQELIVLAAARCGVKVLRGSACWSYVQRTPDSWDFSEPDAQLALLDRQGIAFEPIFSGNTRWATAKDWQPVVEGLPGRGQRPDYDAWRNYIARYCERYGERIPYVVVWNEPDLAGFANFPPEDYVKLLKIAYETCKEKAPKIQVKIGGFSGLDAPYPNRSAAPEYLEKVLAQAQDYYDIFCIHMHGQALYYVQRMPRMAAMRARHGDDKPWFSNETGITSIGRTSEINQAETLVQKLLSAWAHGASGYSWYNLYSKGRDPQDGEHNYGIITADFHPKPAYATYTMLSNYFADGDFVSNTGGLSYSLMLFKDRDGNWLLPHWSWGQEKVSLLVAGISGEARMVDIFGNETAAAIDEGTIMLSAAARPAFLKVSGQALPPLPLGDIIQQDEDFVIFPGQSQAFSFALENKGAAPISYRYRFVPQAGLQVTPAEGQHTVPPGERVGLPVSFAAAADFVGQEVKIEVLVGEQWRLTLPRQLKQGLMLPSEDFSVEPQLELADKTQQRQLVPFEAQWQHLFWSGPEDLSAKAWLRSEQNTLLVKIQVQDDKHCQPFSGREMFQGDNVQLGLQFPQQDRFWEIGLSHRDDGNSEVFIWSAPKGFAAAEVAKQIRLSSSRDEQSNTTTYIAELPLRALGAEGMVGQRRCRFNFLVNDCDDGKNREGYMQQFPGIGGEKNSRHFMPVLY
jgi:hypothetical protein